MSHKTIIEALDHMDLSKYLKIFIDHEVSWDVFALLNDSDLIRMGLPVGPCKKIMRYIEMHYPTTNKRGSRSVSPIFTPPTHSPTESTPPSVVLPPSTSTTAVDNNESNLRVNPLKVLREYQEFKESVQSKFKESRDQVDMLSIRLTTLEQALVKHYQPF